MQIKKLVPPLAPCFSCGFEYVGLFCPACKAEHPTYTAIKNIAKKQEEEGAAVPLAGEVC